MAVFEDFSQRSFIHCTDDVQNLDFLFTYLILGFYRKRFTHTEICHPILACSYYYSFVALSLTILSNNIIIIFVIFWDSKIFHIATKLCLIIPERHVKTYYKGAMLGTQFVSQHETYLPLYI